MVKVKCLCVVSLFAFVRVSAAEVFENRVIGEEIWARTPGGKFQCIASKSTNYHQVLMINRQVIYDGRTAENSDGSLEASNDGIPLSRGIDMGSGIDGGCPSIIENRSGYLIVERQMSPPGSGGEPSAGVYAVSVINFNATPPIIIELSELQRVKDGAPRVKIVVASIAHL